MNVYNLSNHLTAYAVNSFTETVKTVDNKVDRTDTPSQLNSTKHHPENIGQYAKLFSEIKGIQQGLLNINKMQIALQVADETNTHISKDLNSIKDLALRAAEEATSLFEKSTLQIEARTLKSNADALAQNAAYNGIKLNDGTFLDKKVQITGLPEDYINISIPSSRVSNLLEFYISGTPHVTAGTAGNNAVSDITSQTLVISGDASLTVNVSAGSSAKTVADAINSVKQTTGITANASTQLKLDNLNGIASNKALGFKINSTVISNSTVSANNLSTLMASINAVSNTTGVKAAIGTSSSELILSNTDGADILLDDFISTNTADSTVSLEITSIDSRSGLEIGAPVKLVDTISNSSHINSIDSVMAVGQVELSSHKSFSLSGDQPLTTKLIQNNTLHSVSVSDIDISTKVGAQNAIKTLSTALTAIHEIRTDVDTKVSQLSGLVKSLSNVEIPKTRALSRILDPNSSAETLSQTKAQIIKNLSLAMIAQANSRSLTMTKALL